MTVQGYKQVEASLKPRSLSLLPALEYPTAWDTNPGSLGCLLICFLWLLD